MEKSRADYFRKRRADKKNVSVYIDKEKVEKLENKLRAQNLSKTEWLDEVIDNALEIDTVREVVCPYCGHKQRIDFAKDANISTYDHDNGMGEEILYEFFDDNFECSNCEQIFVVKGYISEYPIGALNHEELEVFAKEE